MYIIVRDNNKHHIKKIEVLEVRKFDSIIKLNNGDIIKRRNSQIINNYNLACIVREEIQVRYNFKKKVYEEEGKFVCNICKSSGTNPEYFTLDHIKPLSSYRGNLRNNKEAWSYYWNTNNLQILCKRCNNAKGKLSPSFNYKIDRLARKRNMKNQKRAYSNRAVNKVGFAIGTGKRNRKRIDMDTAMQIAKRDSRVLDLELILGKKKHIKK